MAVTASFANDLLTIIADTLDNNVEASRNAAGTILVNGGAVTVTGGTPTVANTALIQAFGQGGDDTIALNEANGALPAANLFGGTGDDTLVGGSGGDQLFGQDDNDTLLGKGGADVLFGGEGNDTLTGGDADDQMFGQGGNDRMIWNPGDDSDLMEGGDDIDTAEINGGNGDESFTITANGDRVRFDRVTPAPFTLDIGTTEKLVLNANGGNDTIVASGDLAGLIKLTLDGGAGSDTIIGSNGDDALIGGDDGDLIIGKGGNDLALMGDDGDTFQWDAGDGNDTIEGQDGFDAVLFNGTGVNEIFELATNGSRASLFRDVDNVTMDLNSVERIDIGAFGGTDTVVIGDMSGTGVDQVNVGLDASIGAGVSDGQLDSVTVKGTNGADVVTLSSDANAIIVDGLSAQVNLFFADAADQLTIKGLGGDDTINASALAGGRVTLTLDGGDGEDILLGSVGADTLIGGKDNDFIDGNQGSDVALMGEGDDTFVWNPGDGSDTVEGGAGTDTLVFNGANVNEIFDLDANGGRVRMTRNVANITMDLNQVEVIDLNALGGADNITVGDLSGTGVTTVNVNLASAGVGDTQPDTVTARGANAGDIIDIIGAGTSATVVGLSAQINISGAEGANDTLVVQGLDGDDVINATTTPAGVMKLTLDGGAGNDTIFGSQGADTLIGGDGNDTIDGNQGNDTALMGAGNDTFVWNPGDGNDTVEGQDGTDTLLFNGSGASENIDISANGGRVRFFRDVANVTMDLDDVEHVEFNALGGADNIVVGDLSGADAKLVTLDLGAGGIGDGAADTVTVNGTQGVDAIKVVNDAAGIMTVTGLAATVVIEHAEAANDRLVINGQNGADTIDASGVAAGQMQLTINGGLGNDIMIGGAGDDLFNGGDGDDTALMGAGNDTFVWNPGDDNDVVEGQAGTDTMLFNGANIAEKIDIAANGGRVRFTRDIANVVMDLNDVETIKYKALGGADFITVNDLSGTDVKTVDIDLGAAGGGDDLAADAVVINGTSGNDTIALSIVDGKLVVDGLAYQVVIENFHVGDRIQINGLGGDDVIDASALGALAADLSFDGGQGNDVLIGGAGNDVLVGNDGDDVLIGNAGTDVLDGGNGSNLLFQDLAATVTNGALALFGTTAADNITVSRNAAGEIFANGQALPGAPTVANIDVIQVFGKDGNDTLTLDETNGALPRAEMFGGAGNDTITGGSGADQLFGEAGNDTLIGKGGNDTLFGGHGDDTLTGGDGDDLMFGEGGNDRMIWNPGDDTDLMEGGDGIDTAEANGGNGDEVFTAIANGTRVRFDRVNPAPFSLDIGTTENLVVNMNGGNDSFSATGNLAALIKITVDGGDGNDTILGGNGADTLLGGAGNDFIDGNQGNDAILMGDGDDTFQWDPGDGSDTVDGGAGFDTMLFNGANVGEIFDLSANGDHARFTRNVANIVMDLDNLEHIRLNALGGADTVTIGDMSGTDVKQVDLDLAAQGALTPDQQLDTVVVSGSNAGNQIKLFDVIDAVAGGKVQITGLPGEVNIAHTDTTDTLTVKGLGGDDTIDASAVTGAMKLTLEGGAGNDTIVASVKADVIDGGEGNDTVSFAGSAAGVMINLATGDAHGGNAEGDTLIGIENVTGTAHNDVLSGSNTANVIAGGAGDDVMSGGAGDDTAVFNVDFNTVTVSFEGSNIVIESAEGRDVLNGIEHLRFTDGTIDLKDENPLVNDLFYYAHNKDVWDSGIDADVHYATFGFREGRDPNAEFSTNGYLSANADVRAAGLNPLEHFATIGFKEGRDPSAHFDIEQYLAANPDVAISGVDPLTHYEAFGRDEGRAIFGAVGKPSHNGFDAEFYLLNNPDVGFAGADPLQHYQVFGHNEGRDPNAFFSVKGYLAAYSDVAAAGVDPFQHYLTFGAAEGRDPSGAFDTRAYLAANPDVAAAGVNPLLHFLEFGVHEGRSPHGDGLFA